MNLEKLIRHQVTKKLILTGFLLLLLFISGVVHGQEYYETWHSRSSTTTLDLNSVIHAEGIFVAVGGTGTVAVSSDGTTWASQVLAGTNSLMGVTHGKGIFVAVGVNGDIVTSPDGTDWTAQVSGTTEDLQSVTYGKGIFVAVASNGVILTSPDGTVWTPQVSGITAVLVHVVYGNNTFVAVGFSGTVLTSPNGIKWTERTPSYELWIPILRGLTYGGGMFVAAGSHGIIVTSPNGIKWTERTSGVTASDMFFGVTYARGLFTAVANHGRVVTSPDGITWTAQDLGDQTFESVSYGERTLVIVGDTGIALQSNATSPCVYTPAAAAVNFPNYKKGSKMVKVTATGEICDAPDLIPGAEWMDAEVTQWKNNSGTVKITVSEHFISHAPRSASLSIEGGAVDVSQAGPNCDIRNMDTVPYSAPAGGGNSTFSFHVYPILGCAYDVTTANTYIHIGAIDSDVLGTKTVHFTVDPNGTTAARTGKITVTIDEKKKKLFTVKQAKP